MGFRRSGEERLWSAGILELMGQTAAELAGFGQYFLTRGLGEGEHHFLVFQRVQEGDVVLIIDDDNGEDGP